MQVVSPSYFLTQTFNHIVFAGGGNRCWWQAGFVEILATQPCWQPKRFIGVSAGAGVATAIATGKIKTSLQAAFERFEATPRNIEWGDLLKGKRPFLMPRIYPDWIMSFLTPDDFAALQHLSIKVDVVVTRPIRFLPLSLSTAIALVLYSSEKFWLKNFHANLPHKLGFRAEYVDLASSENWTAAKQLLMASAAAVPITPIYKVHGKAALDGGFYDNAPLPQNRTDDANTLVLLTRHRPDLPAIFTLNNRFYVQPFKAVAAINMDCTSGQAVIDTYEQGKRDAFNLIKHA